MAKMYENGRKWGNKDVTCVNVTFKLILDSELMMIY